MENLEERAKAIEEQIENCEQLPSTDTKPELPVSQEVIEDISLQALQNKFLQNQIESGKTLTEISADYAKASVTNEIINSNTQENKKYRQELAEEQKKTLKEGFKQDRKKEETKTLTEERKKAEAFYTAFRPILEYDFSNLIRKNGKDNEVNTKTYEDRSYGISLMVGMLLFLTVPYFIISVILALFNGINALLEEINTFGKIAKYVVLSIVLIFFAVLIVYCTLFGINKIFGTSILGLV